MKELEHRAMAWLIAGGALATCLAGALLVWGLVPRLLADPALADSTANITSAFTVFVVMAVGASAVALAGLRLARRTLGRVLLSVGGLLEAADGLLMVNIATIQGGDDLHLDAGEALMLGVGAAVWIAAGVLACTASTSTRLPGQSLGARMMRAHPGPVSVARQRLVLLAAAGLVGGWLLVLTAFLANHTETPFTLLQFLAPILVGILVAAWREGMPDRLRTLGFASLGGAAANWVFLVALIVAQFYRFNPVGYFVWWGLMGGALGGIGYGLWLMRPRWSRTAVTA